MRDKSNKDFPAGERVRKTGRALLLGARVSAVLLALDPMCVRAAPAPPVPALSGVWAHFTWPDAEPPETGPGPIVNLSLRDGASDPYQLAGDYRNPILRPNAAQIVKRFGEESLAGKTYATPSNQCWPGGVPFVFIANIGMQMIQQRDAITILYTNDHEVRHVRLGGRHPKRIVPSWYGDSIARYDGDTLVIDTVGVKIGPYAMLDLYGTPHSPSLHVVERYRLLDNETAKRVQERNLRGLSRLGRDPGLAADPGDTGPGLQLDFTIEDENVFTRAWSGTISYRRPLGAWPEMACADNPIDYIARGVKPPTAAKPDF